MKIKKNFESRISLFSHSILEPTAEEPIPEPIPDLTLDYNYYPDYLYDDYRMEPIGTSNKQPIITIQRSVQQIIQTTRPLLPFTTQTSHVKILKTWIVVVDTSLYVLVQHELHKNIHFRYPFIFIHLITTLSVYMFLNMTR